MCPSNENVGYNGDTPTPRNFLWEIPWGGGLYSTREPERRIISNATRLLEYQIDE